MEERRMGLSRRRFTREFKITAVRRLQQGESVAVLARALEVNAGLLHRWREEFRHEPRKAFPGSGRRGAEPDRVAQLERKIGQQALEIDFLKGCLQSIEEQRGLQAGKPKPPSTGKSKGSEREVSR
jgi:transposase-like protein